MSIGLNQMSNITLSQQNIKSKIYTIRNQQVMIDSDLALLYNVEIKTFNQAIKRNIKRWFFLKKCG